LGARSTQIRDRLLEKSQFNEADFNALQLDNEARFLMPWHALLLAQLKKQPVDNKGYISVVENWQACACPDSVGYTLVRRYRDAIIDSAFSGMQNTLEHSGGSLKYIKRDLEPAIWQLIEQQPASWLNPEYNSWDEQLSGAFAHVINSLTDQFGGNMQSWRWGNVNELAIEHPFAKQIPQLSQFLNMPKAPGFGDSFMPAVQGQSFGASQRFIAQPGYLERAVMAIPGGQSGHPLSPFYRAGFDEYVNGALTPLLPQAISHKIVINPSKL
jgi:penicillin amidase